ncbi:MAG: ferritin family protein [Theionarchaea archaeon]|nr:ferritin family protein [Theionarchaea archaeon]
MNEAEVLGTALNLEKKGFTFYSEAEKKTENRTGKKMFAQLAREEEDHIRDIKNMFKNLYPQRSEVDIPVFDEDISEYSGEVEALRIGIEMEKKSIEFYTDWAEGNLGTLFKRLIEIEKSHLELLEAELDYVKRTGFWFDYFESSLED